jgi:hypothetical protein
MTGDVVELRALNVGNKTHAGYFNDFDRLAGEVARLSGQATGVYVILNRINPVLLARSKNRITIGPKNLTQDTDITLRRWLPVDVAGLNCSVGPKTILETIEKMAPLATKPLSAMPNAGLPATVEGRKLYLCSPCLNLRGITKAELIEGAEIVAAGTLVDEVMSASQVVTY